MQHYDRRGQYDISLAKIDEAIEHTPTVIDLYSIKVCLYYLFEWLWLPVLQLYVIFYQWFARAIRLFVFWRRVSCEDHAVLNLSIPF